MNPDIESIVPQATALLMAAFRERLAATGIQFVLIAAAPADVPSAVSTAISFMGPSDGTHLDKLERIRTVLYAGRCCISNDIRAVFGGSRQPEPMDLVQALNGLLADLGAADAAIVIVRSPGAENVHMGATGSNEEILSALEGAAEMIREAPAGAPPGARTLN